MIVIVDDGSIRKIISQISTKVDNSIYLGMEEGAKAVADNFRELAVNKLFEEVESHKGIWTGNLAESTQVKSGDLGFKSLARYDVVVDTNRAPYFFWIEDGSGAQIGLPYSKVGNKDYSKSKFKGYKFIKSTLREIKKPENSTMLVLGKIVKNIYS